MSGRHYPDQSDSKLGQPDMPATEAPLSTDTSLNSADSTVSADEAWQRVTSRMRQDIGEAAWRNWIKPLRVSRLEDGTLTLEASSMLARERVTSQYADRLRVISAAEYGTVRKVEISLASQQAPRMSQQKRAASSGKAAGGEPLGAGLDPRYTFANFVVGKPNELAFAVARRTAESSTVAFNPLFLYGGVGLGKTHLMHAIAWHIREQDPKPPCGLSVGREIHVPVCAGAAVPRYHVVQGAVPLGRRADDR
jgi:chromosomal replication initiator protein